LNLKQISETGPDTKTEQNAHSLVIFHDISGKPGGTGMSPFWILLELRMMEVVSGDKWSYKTCKAPVKSSPTTNQHPVFYRPDVLPVAIATVSEY